jgi:hypothetical protein
VVAGVGVAQVPEPLQYLVLVWIPLVQEEAWQTVLVPRYWQAPLAPQAPVSPQTLGSLSRQSLSGSVPEVA